MKKIVRYGAYGIVIKEGKILLSLKKTGPYKDFWDLPGGKIEFGETPEETLKRELLEEVAICGNNFQLLFVGNNIAEYKEQKGKYKFHHLGIVYKVKEFLRLSNLICEETNSWFLLNEMPEKLTPFAKQFYENKYLSNS